MKHLLALPVHRVLCVLALVLNGSGFASAETPIEVTHRGELIQTNLFESGTQGYKLYRIPGIVATKRGVLLAYCEARKSDSGDWGPIDVYMRRSLDQGKTWLPRQQIVHVTGNLPVNPVAAAQGLDKAGENTVNNPVAIVDGETGAVHFLYCLEYMRCFYMRSDDDGATWTTPMEITKTFEAFRDEYDWKVLATGPGHGIQLTRGEHRGRLVVPVWLSLGTGGHAHRPSVTSTIYSDDHGQTWQRGEIAVPDTSELIYPNETAVVELSDGTVMLNTRSESQRHRRLVTVSPNGATDWSEPKFDEALLEPICMAGLVRVRQPNSDRPGLLAFSNPDNLRRRDGKEKPGGSRDRENVSIKLSDDDGRTWPVHRTLESGFSGYSDLAALPDGTIFCFYERGSTDGKSRFRTGQLTVARFDEAWVRGEASDADQSDTGGKKVPNVLNVWPSDPPDETLSLPPESDQTKPDDKLIAGRRIIKLGNVSTPQIAVYRPDPAIDTGAAVVICPGGGHYILAYDLEGTEIAEWLNDIGITAIVLKYRVPSRDKDRRWIAAVQDAQRAMSLVRSKATDWDIDPKRIGICGFSAGGETAALTCVFRDARQYDAIDSVDQVSSVPDFAMLIYPAGFVQEGTSQLRDYIEVTEKTPPMFFVHAFDDDASVLNSLALASALKEAGGSAELHIYASGGHGYGLRKTDQPVTHWPQDATRWLQKMSLIPERANADRPAASP